MTLTEEQIANLYAFTKKHYVEYYDVQTELVDHLANGIEAQWSTNPNLHFDEALKTAFKKFGIFGFSEILEQKEWALVTYYRKEVWLCLKEYFKLPKIIITLFSIWAVFKTMFLFENKENLALILTLSVMFLHSFFFVKEWKRIKKSHKQTGKKWLFETVILQFGGLIQLLYFGSYVQYINVENKWNSLLYLAFSACLVLYALLLFVAIKVVSPKLKEKFSKEYPEYKF